jgi:AraC-like DNA-binding protein
MIRDMRVRANESVKAPPPAHRSSARVHLGPLRGIPLVLEHFGVPSEPVLTTVGLRRDDFEKPDRSAPFADLDRLLGLCIRKTECDHFGLLLSQYVSLQSFGITGRLARNSASVGAALQDLAGFFLLHDNGGSINLSIHDGSVTFGYGIHVPGIRHADQVYDLAVGGMVNIMRELCGPDWRPAVVLLPRKRPPSLRPYRERLLAPLRFDSVMAGITFPEPVLSRPIVDADSYLHALLAENASAALSRTDPLLHSDVRRAIRLQLLTQQCSRREVARQLGLHERTLGRRLQASGVTFQRVLDETRVELAKQLLNDTLIPVARISTALGYRDPTVFTRAFARWTGKTPSRFRAELSQSP